MELFKQRELLFTKDEFYYFGKKSINGVKLFYQKKVDQFSTFEILAKLINEFWENDWVQLREDLEEFGEMTFFKFFIGRVELSLTECNGDFFFNNIVIHQCSIKEKYDNNLMKKLRNKTFLHLKNNQYQFELFIKEQKRIK